MSTQSLKNSLLNFLFPWRKRKLEFLESLTEEEWKNLVWSFYEPEFTRRGLTPKPRHIVRLKGNACGIAAQLLGKSSFTILLQWYMPPKLLKEEFLRKDFLLRMVEKDEAWTGGCLVVPFGGKIK